MIKVLVTGGAGFIGSHTVVELQNAGYEPVIVDNLFNASVDVIDNIAKITGKKPFLKKLAITRILEKDADLIGMINLGIGVIVLKLVKTFEESIGIKLN